MDPYAFLFAKTPRLKGQEQPSQEDFERVEGASHLGYKDLYSDGANLHMFHPEMASSGCAHSKILILVYPGFMRLVVTSANLLNSDTEYGDNHYYIQGISLLSPPTLSDLRPDFPALSLEAARSYEEPKFQTDLCAHIRDLRGRSSLASSEKQ
ncbi:hypothetical protein FB45DRAFT_1140836 [Roridomyces roridus]|uniref:Tyrosyl-DNA phosphodiesterase n=1 Tax=Roridomyces roridus TaxID=1738132 RepID=A0AAD7B023_9AGAR|nr:hypothetical protein FB45DRAFT_1140836 [Roridomyces roridus]